MNTQNLTPDANAVTTAREAELQSLFDQAHKHSHAGEMGEAVRLFDKIIEIDPDMPAAYYFKGIALGNAGQHEEAVQSFQQALHRTSQSPQILYSFAISCLHTERWQAAMTALLQILGEEDNAGSPQIQMLLGFAASKACQITIFAGFDDFMRFEAGMQDGVDEEKYVVDLDDSRAAMLYALALAGQIKLHEAKQQLENVTLHDGGESAWLKEVGSALELVARWALNQASNEEVARTEPDENHEKLQWEESNGPLREQIARLSRYRVHGLEASPEDRYGLFSAFCNAQLLVPVDNMVQQEAGGQAFSPLIQSHPALGERPVFMAFTSVAEARAYFDSGYQLNRVIMWGESLANLAVSVAGAVQTIGASDEGRTGDAEHEVPEPLAGVVIDPAGQRPYVLNILELEFIVRHVAPQMATAE